jgi:hypothetical protein
VCPYFVFFGEGFALAAGALRFFFPAFTAAGGGGGGFLGASGLILRTRKSRLLSTLLGFAFASASKCLSCV